MTAKRGRGEAEQAAEESDALPTSDKRQKRDAVESKQSAADGTPTAQEAAKVSESAPQTRASSGGADVASGSAQSDKPPIEAVSMAEGFSAADALETSSDDEPLLPARGSTGAGIKLGSECPYLDTVNRQVRSQTFMRVSKPQFICHT